MRILYSGVSISTVLSSTKSDWKCSQTPYSQFSSVLTGCFPPHPVWKDQSAQPSLLICLHPFQFSQLNCVTRPSHKQLDHNIPVCLCSLIAQHVCLVLNLLPSGTAIMPNVACEQDGADSPCVRVDSLSMRCWQNHWGESLEWTGWIF